LSELEHLVPVQNQLGESPIWVAEEKAVYWVGWGSNHIFRLDRATGTYRTYEIPLAVTALARRAAGGWVVTGQTGLAFWDPHTGDFELVTGQPEADSPHFFFNDCVVDRQGRFLVGTYNGQDPWAPDSSLYRLNPDGSICKLDTGFATVNGLGLSPDGATLYVTDMRHSQIFAYDYDTATGDLGQRRLFARVPPEEGLPDGLIVDSQGFVWSAHWGGWKVTRYDLDGKIEREVRFPVQQVTCLAFGGENLDELYITTGWYGFSEEERKAQPTAGDLLRVKTDIRGLEEPGFMG
jgi:sugar lactone lactonase YvrE